MTQLTAANRRRLPRRGRFTFSALERATRGMSGPARAEVFYSLPLRRQAEAWSALRRSVEAEREQ
jgi:hypothetical protein